jgi:uncharacterized protein (TIGR02466 family)
MINTFAWRTKTNIVEYSNIFQIENAVPPQMRNQLVSEILSNKDSNTDNSGSEENCWRGHPTFKDTYITDLILTAFDAYVNSLPDSAMMTHSANPADKFDQNIPLIHYWANVNSKGGYNISHNHSGSLLSGVIYLQATETGMIEFQPINHIYKINHPCWFYNGSMQYHPKDGDILLFPSYLLHWVEPNPADRDRINIAFNITYAPK